MKKQTLLIVAVLIFSSSLIFAQSRTVGTIAGGTIAGGVVNGKAISLPAPSYPAAAKAVNASGAVSVQVLIDENGDVISASAVSGHPLLRAAAENAARNAKFRPTQLSGQPVKVSGVITYVFSLPNNNEATAGDSAQENSVNPIQTVRNIELTGISAALRLMTKFNADERFDSVFNEFLNSINSSELADLPEDFSVIKELPKQTRSRRAEILNTVTARLRETAIGNQSWYFSFGENLGDLLAESIKHRTIGQADNYSVKNSFARIKDLLVSPPPDFPRDLSGKIKEIVEFSETNNLNNENILTILDEKLEAIGDSIFESND